MTAAPSTPSSHRGVAVPFALAGLAIVGQILDEIDTPHDNAQSVAVLACGALLGLVAWGVARRVLVAARLPQLAEGAWDAVRYVLAFQMVRYGLAKIVGMQFYPRYWALDSRAGDLDSMSVAWLFFGRSYGYQFAAGAIELGSAVLLAFRRTALLGACLLATALTNVVLVNFSYDVTVKLFASLYLLFDVSLIAREAPRLWGLFFPPGARQVNPTSAKARLLRGAVLALALGLPAAEIVHDAIRYGIFHRDPLEGAWIVESRSGLDDLLPALPGAWDEVSVEKWRAGTIRVGRKHVGFAVEVDPTQDTLSFTHWKGYGANGLAPLAGTFVIEGDELKFSGSRNGVPFAVAMRRDLP